MVYFVNLVVRDSDGRVFSDDVAGVFMEREKAEIYADRLFSIAPCDVFDSNGLPVSDED